MYKVSEFAEKAGVTVRTLHHYDRLGLLKPSGRSTAGYRLYADRDFVRLQQIVTLKFIGLPLKDIKALLDSSDLDLKATLRLQRRLLTEKRRQLETAIAAIEEAEAEAERAIASRRAPDLAALKKIIEVMERQNDMEWTKKYYSEEAQAKIEERKKLLVTGKSGTLVQGVVGPFPRRGSRPRRSPISLCGRYEQCGRRRCNFPMPGQRNWRSRSTAQ